MQEVKTHLVQTEADAVDALIEAQPDQEITLRLNPGCVPTVSAVSALPELRLQAVVAQTKAQIAYMLKHNVSIKNPPSP